MLIKIYWKCCEITQEVYALKKTTTKVMGFIYPIAVKEHRYLPHWTYHSDGNRVPKIHHRSRSGKILDFMTLAEPYLKRFDRFEGVVWSVPGLGAPFNLLHAINVEGHPGEAARTDNNRRHDAGYERSADSQYAEEQQQLRNTEYSDYRALRCRKQ